MVHGEGQQIGIRELARLQQTIGIHERWFEQAHGIGPEAVARMADQGSHQRSHHSWSTGAVGVAAPAEPPLVLVALVPGGNPAGLALRAGGLPLTGLAAVAAAAGGATLL